LTSWSLNSGPLFLSAIFTEMREEKKKKKKKKKEEEICKGQS